MEQQFKKSIKRNPIIFVVLKNGSQFKTWNLTLLATAASQEVFKVLDPNYTPISSYEIELFK